MGAYLSQPNTVKCSGDGVGAPRLPLPYGFSAMQGWRVSMEVTREGFVEWSLEGGNPMEKKGAGGWGRPRGRVRIESLSPQRQFFFFGGGDGEGSTESGAGAERELPGTLCWWPAWW